MSAMQEKLKYGLIGRHIEHSLSPSIFEEKWRELGLEEDFQYDLISFDSTQEVRRFVQAQVAYKGLNVTMPFKKDVVSLCHGLDAAAESLAVVNTLKFVDGKIYGSNTDVVGIRSSLMGFKDSFKRALILGTGASAKSVAYVLRELQIPHQFVSRGKREEGIISYDQLQEWKRAELISIDLLVNTTPLGAPPWLDQMPPIPIQLIHDKITIFDLIYNPAQTPLLVLGAQKGASCINGMLMLKRQADAAWDIWMA